jgi:CheY-like chemotaxis protein
MRSLKIMIVDDNVDAADSLTALLQLSGHDVRAVYSGSGALSQALIWQPEVVICDLSLPDVDGYEVVRGLRKLSGLEQVNVIALTGYSQTHFLRRAVTSGFNHYLVKPVNIDQLLTLLHAESVMTS